MKVLDITMKDLKHIFQSPFSLVMMFVAPLLITGLLYFAFSGISSGGGFNLPVTEVQVANLNQPNSRYGGFAAGELLVQFLQDEGLADMISVRLAVDEAAARAAVDGQKAGVAIIIPPGFTAAALAPERSAAVTLYQDPTLTLGPSIVKDLVNHFMDGFSGSKIASQVTLSGFSAQGRQPDALLASAASQQYAAWLQSGGHDSGEGSAPRLAVVSPSGNEQAEDYGASMVGPIMAGMVVFFVFFIGANGAESIIREDEDGTLRRLFTTPTPLSAILGGKFLSVLISLCFQTALLLLASSLLFGIHWGQTATVVLISAGLVVAAAGFGVMLMSFIKNKRQTGPVIGGVMTLAGMLGGLFTTGVPNLPPFIDKVTLIVPHGWALQGWKLALTGAGPGEALVYAAVMLGLGLLFFAIGGALFRKRFA